MRSLKPSHQFQKSWNLQIRMIPLMRCVARLLKRKLREGLSIRLIIVKRKFQYNPIKILQPSNRKIPISLATKTHLEYLFLKASQRLRIPVLLVIPLNNLLKTTHKSWLQWRIALLIKSKPWNQHHNHPVITSKKQMPPNLNITSHIRPLPMNALLLHRRTPRKRLQRSLPRDWR